MVLSLTGHLFELIFIHLIESFLLLLVLYTTLLGRYISGEIPLNRIINIFCILIYVSQIRLFSGCLLEMGALKYIWFEHEHTRTDQIGFFA